MLTVGEEGEETHSYGERVSGEIHSISVLSWQKYQPEIYGSGRELL